MAIGDSLQNVRAAQVIEQAGDQRRLSELGRKQETERKSALQARIPELAQQFRTDPEGAFASLLGVVDPDKAVSLMQTELGKKFGSSRKVQEALKTTPGKIETGVDRETGTTEQFLVNPITGKTKTLGFGPEPKDDSEPLRSFQIEPLEEAITSKDQVENFTQIGKKLLKQKKAFGPLEGRVQEFQAFLGTAEPDVAEFIANRELNTVALAKAMNGGRPSKEDQAAMGKFLAELKQNPASALSLLDGAMAAAENSISNAFVLQYQAATPGQKQQIAAIAKSQGIDLQEELKLRAKANEENVSMISIRKDIINGNRNPLGEKLKNTVKFKGEKVKVGEIVELINPTSNKTIKVKITGADKKGDATFEIVK